MLRSFNGDFSLLELFFTLRSTKLELTCEFLFRKEFWMNNDFHVRKMTNRVQKNVIKYKKKIL